MAFQKLGYGPARKFNKDEALSKMPFDNSFEDMIREQRRFGRPASGMKISRAISYLTSKKQREEHAQIAAEAGLLERKPQFTAVGDSRVQDPAYYRQMEELFGIEDHGLNEI